MQPGKQSGIRRVTSWQLVGAQLRHFRKLAGLTQAARAEQAGVGEDTIASIEQGRRALQLDLAIQLDELLDTKGALRVAVERIPRKERYQALVKDFVQYEQDAVSLFSYQSQLIPGLLQTEAYARFIFDCNYPPLEEDEIEKRVADRLGRQKILERKPRPILHFILEESILHAQMGDPADVSAPLQRYGMLRSQALTVAESTRLLDALLDALLGETCPAQHTPPLALPNFTGSSPATATVTAATASKSPPTPPPSTSATPR